MSWILLNVPLALVMLAFTVGLPMWVMAKHPEENAPVAIDAAVLRPVAATPAYVGAGART
jgi:hypothetical protein